jgi:hypothetical protein
MGLWEVIGEPLMHSVTDAIDQESQA